MTNAYLEQIVKFTSIGRPLDPRYPTNLAIMLYAALGGVIAGILSLISGDDFLTAVVAGIFTGGATFLAWAFAREIDPDHDLSAFVAATFALAASLFLTPLHLLALGTLLILTRIVNRIVGPPAKLWDTLLGVMLTTAVIFSGQWVFGLVGILAFVMDAVLDKPLRLQWIGAGVITVAMAAYLVMNGAGEPGTLSIEYLIVVLAITVFFLIITAMTRHVRSTSDYDDQPLNVHRIQADMLLVLAAGLVMLWHGDNGVAMMLPVWAVLFGISVYRLFHLETRDQVSIVRQDPSQSAKSDLG
ncbi:MAG: hypothetical protein OHK0046_22480 [Anaerolineae bacterium]